MLSTRFLNPIPGDGHDDVYRFLKGHRPATLPVSFAQHEPGRK